MKNIFLAIALFVIIPNSMNGNFTDTKQESTIVITSDLMTCKSSLKHKADKWQVRHIKPLKLGVNKFYFVPFNGMSVNIEILKY